MSNSLITLLTFLAGEQPFQRSTTKWRRKYRKRQWPRTGINALHLSCSQTQGRWRVLWSVMNSLEPSLAKSPFAITTWLKMQSEDNDGVLNAQPFVLDSRYVNEGSCWRYNAVINSKAGWPSFVGAALLRSQRSCEAQGIIATTLAAQLTAEQGSKSWGDDKTSACRKTIQSDSSKEAL